MKTIHTYISEKFQVSKDNIRTYAYTPKDKNELIDCIIEKIDKEGLGTKNNPLDLNDIDTSKITDMGHLFRGRYYLSELRELSENGYFDVSDWDVSNVENMYMMFYNSNFDGDLSDWDVSNVKDMSSMFNGSAFTGKNGDISEWDISKVETMYSMFRDSKFDSNISRWDVSKVKNMTNMFYNCYLGKNPPKWYRE